MVATGISRMLTVAVARFEPTRAVTITDPLAIPLMTPALDTVAIELLDVDQLLAVPGTTRPLSSYNVATSCSVVFALIELFAGVMRIDPIVFCLTEIVAEPLALPVLAMSMASPTPIVETMPLSLTVATDESDVDQRTASLEEAPDRLDALAENCSCAPNGMLTMAGSTRKLSVGRGEPTPIARSPGPVSSHATRASALQTLVRMSVARDEWIICPLLAEVRQLGRHSTLARATAP